jgi:O-antigen/teichoic acid export membrane protein
MKKIIPIILIVLLCCVGFAIFAGANGFWKTPDTPDTDEDEYPYPISFLKIDTVFVIIGCGVFGFVWSMIFRKEQNNDMD